MAAIWPAFQSQLVGYLKNKKAKKDEETAKKIGTLYHQAVKTAMPVLVPGATLMGGSAAPVINGFKTSFKLGRKLKGKKPTPAIWAAAASGLVLYWTGKTFSPVPPPTWISGTNPILVPGVPPAPLIYTAMQAKTPELVAAGLVSAFTTHLLSVSGIFTGPNAGSAGAPVPFPWVAIA
jgi:hypothetical protein|tara:strand:- start:779 stop:1312 length:534 start_codon:yes stop_codon:yes gene_type:complete